MPVDRLNWHFFTDKYLKSAKGFGVFAAIFHKKVAPQVHQTQRRRVAKRIHPRPVRAGLLWRGHGNSKFCRHRIRNRGRCARKRFRRWDGSPAGGRRTTSSGVMHQR